MGCVMQVGDQAVNVGRNAALAAGFPESTVGTTVDRQCGSSQQAAHFAAQGVIAGAYDVVVAAGVESMTRVPMGASFTPGSQPFGPKVFARYQERGGLVPQGISAELIAEKWDISREDNDRFSRESHLRAARATDEGRFEQEIVPVQVAAEDGTALFSRDEGIRPDSSLEKLATLKPAFKPDGVVTAGNSSQISDGAAAMLVTSEEAASRLGLTPKARFHTFALAGVDPVFMLTGPIPATTKVLERAKMTLTRWTWSRSTRRCARGPRGEKEHHPDMAKVNVNGGAIALGHPLGCSGARLAATLVHELERIDGRWGLQVMCEGGGMANAMIIERLADPGAALPGDRLLLRCRASSATARAALLEFTCAR
jgi:acetyl-CoA acetyltransferase family protein